MEVAEAASWVAADYAWDPHRLVAVQDSSATALHVNTAAGGTQPDSIVPPVLPVLESTPAPSERSVSPSACCKVRAAGVSSLQDTAKASAGEAELSAACVSSCVSCIAMVAVIVHPQRSCGGCTLQAALPRLASRPFCLSVVCRNAVVLQCTRLATIKAHHLTETHVLRLLHAACCSRLKAASDCCGMRSHTISASACARSTCAPWPSQSMARSAGSASSAPSLSQWRRLTATRGASNLRSGRSGGEAAAVQAAAVDGSLLWQALSYFV